MTHTEMVRKLIGPIHPLGDSSRDDERFENLKQMCALIEALILDVDDVAFDNKDSHEFSVKRAADHAKKFLSEISKEFISTTP
jgi:hypothetical protein